MSLSLEETIKRANNDGIKYMLTISTEDKSFNKILKIITKYSCVYGTYGIHPHEAKLHKSIKTEKILQKINLNKKIIGIGETGLDFYYNHSDKNDQINVNNVTDLEVAWIHNSGDNAWLPFNVKGTDFASMSTQVIPDSTSGATYLSLMAN